MRVWHNGISQDYRQEFEYYIGGSFLLRSFTFTGTLHWTDNRPLITDMGSNPKLVTFFIGEPIYFIILEL